MNEQQPQLQPDKKPVYVARDYRKCIRLVEIRRVDYEPIHRTTETLKVEGIGNIPVREFTGRWNKNRLHVSPTKGSMTYAMDANRDGIRGTLRRLRDQEAEKIANIESEIRRLEQLREQTIREAWTAGNVVTVKELTDLIKQP